MKMEGRGLKREKQQGKYDGSKRRGKIMRCFLFRAGDPSLLYVLHEKRKLREMEENQRV